MKKISKELMESAINLSSEWNNTGFIVENKDGSLDSTVWNHWNHEEFKRTIVAYVNGNDGFNIKSEFKEKYEFEVEPEILLS